MHDHDHAHDAAPNAETADAVPDKFRDPDSGAVRVDALVKSYRALERKLGAGAHLAESDPAREADEFAVGDEDFEGAFEDDFEADGFHDEAGEGDQDGEGDDFGQDGDAEALADEFFAIETDHPWLESDPEVNAMLHEAGFTPDQAQLVYDLAAEKVVPLLGSLVREVSSLRERSAIEADLGGAEGFEETARQLRAWGQANLPPDVYAALAASPNGVRALRRLMTSDEPSLLPAGDAAAGLDEAGLRRLMDDPRYWRDADPGIVRQVEDGFRRLYPNG
ncbi:MAG: hypothetical protein RLT05_01015 [Bauldia litoralis]